MMGENRLRELAEQLVDIDGIVAVTLGGSRARGDHAADSDFDLGLYYRPPLDLAGLAALARTVAGPDATVTEPGAWGRWVDGGAWLMIDRSPVDWIYRELSRVEAAWRDAGAGRYEFHAQVGHPLGVPDFAYAGEVALARILADPSGVLASLQQQAQHYPAALSTSVVRGLREADFLLTIAAKAVSREDVTYVAGCIFRALLLCAHAIHADARQWLVNEKGAIAKAGALPGAPNRFTSRAHGLLAQLGGDADALAASIDSARALVTETRARLTDAA